MHTILKSSLDLNENGAPNVSFDNHDSGYLGMAVQLYV